MRDKCMRGQPLQTDLPVGLAAYPYDAELGLFLTHAHVKDLALPNSPSHALDHQATNAHVGYKSGMSKRLAIGIHSPNLHRELDFDSWALASIHADIVRPNRWVENLRGLPRAEYWSFSAIAC